ncbi:patatin-like phospholipase family protein [Mycolicibacter kumamotonensis]|jgi:NTE family protein|uniref:Phospholipase n=1 Tax=Mycolicibacter kumamotonensis TaxID=354243 RepID=A0A1B8SGG8_9MYCO|nr:patatin-like phospholipase family protein [Mycolicibacter kumamotonensis]NDJ87625.1 patatin-like phospholipase family protein [Mycolicibacter kumamotonensis]OBY31786.1 phospholipase [Mycolicibacter kumamotonensis]ORA81056.1 phospholipase [Mycolicibacter kumamotonensis]
MAARSPKTQPLTADLVLSGGGVRFIGLVGAVVALMDAGYSTQRISGVSGGSVVATILAAAAQGDQLSAAQVKEMALSVPLQTWRDAAAPVPLLGAAYGFLRDSGLYRGDVAHDWIRSELANLGVSTWGDLRYDEDNLLTERRYRAVVTVTDVTTGQLVRLPWDYRRVYGLDPDEQSVADAVRASMSVPFFYRPVTLTSAAGRRSTLVDGGVLSNFPIYTFDRLDGRAPLWPTFGVTVVPELSGGDIGDMVPSLRPLRVFGQSRLLENLISTLLIGHDQTYLNQPWVSVRAIKVNPTDVGVLDFGISRARLEALYENGYVATQQFLSTWDWPAYLERFRVSHYPGGVAPTERA